jgi:cell division protein FtsI/penicillin-binding protein 2
MSRLLRLPALALVGVLLTTACSLPGSGPDPEASLEGLASALQKGDLAGVSFASDGGAARSAYADIVAGLEALGRPQVEVGEVTQEGDDATGTLSWTWRVAEETWTYDTQVEMTKGSGDDGGAWQVEWSPKVVEPSLEQGETLQTSTIKPRRGDILGADDEPLVTLRPVLRVGVDKNGLTPAAAQQSATRVAALIDVDRKDFVEQVRRTGPKAFVQGIVYRRTEAPTRVLDRISDIPGGRAISDHLPLAPTKDFASGLLGTVGPATAEVVEDSDGRLRGGDDAGLSGLQKRYDEQLFGARGATVVAVDDEGERRNLVTADAQPGEPLRLTLDRGVQQVAEQVLADVGPPSGLVAIQPSTGNVLAAASGPGSKGYNTATFGQYAPGSTFKVVTALALLRGGLSPSTRVSCPPTTVVDGKSFKNYDDYPAGGLGRITLADAVANSCNTAFIGQRDRIGEGGLAAAAAALGLGVDHDLGFPAYFGNVADPKSETQAAASTIGQGTVLASPMAMATVVASVLAGKAVLPVLVPGHEVKQQQPEQPLTDQEAQQLRGMMRGVVERGSGTLLQGVRGGEVIAKTGTAEFGTEPPLPTHAWMVAGRGDLAVAVFVERGDSGSGTAGPILRRFLDTAPAR